MKTFLAILFITVATLPVAAQSAAAAVSPGFQLALPGYQWNFPRDHGAHPHFANEWWYWTGNLSGAHGQRFGFELTFFRVSPNPDAPLDRDFYLAHFALTDVAGNRFFFHERSRRGAWGQAGVRMVAPGPNAGLQCGAHSGLRLWNENWTADFLSSGACHLQARWGDYALDLQLDPHAARMFNGPGGLSQKGPAHGQASYYYSVPRASVNGVIEFAGSNTQVTGAAWMDHEFASNQLGTNQQGWDWMGLQLTEAGKPLDVMLFNLRDTNGSRDPYSSGTCFVEHSGRSPSITTWLKASDFKISPFLWWRSPITRARYPVAWTVEIPRRGLKLQVRAAIDNQELRGGGPGLAYWEGAVVVKGTGPGGASVEGRGYLELTGYAGQLRITTAHPAGAH